MKNVAVYEAKAKFSELLAAIQAGEEFNITRHGKPVARLVAASPEAQPNETRAAQREAVTDAISRLKTLGKAIRMESDLRAIVGEGRD
jgi:prevent-host-death family protein